MKWARHCSGNGDLFHSRKRVQLEQCMLFCLLFAVALVIVRIIFRSVGSGVLLACLLLTKSLSTEWQFQAILGRREPSRVVREIVDASVNAGLPISLAGRPCFRYLSAFLNSLGSTLRWVLSIGSWWCLAIILAVNRSCASWFSRTVWFTRASSPSSGSSCGTLSKKGLLSAASACCEHQAPATLVRVVEWRKACCGKLRCLLLRYVSGTAHRAAALWICRPITFENGRTLGCQSQVSCKHCSLSHWKLGSRRGLSPFPFPLFWSSRLNEHFVPLLLCPWHDLSRWWVCPGAGLPECQCPVLSTWCDSSALCDRRDLNDRTPLLFSRETTFPTVHKYRLPRSS